MPWVGRQSRTNRSFQWNRLARGTGSATLRVLWFAVAMLSTVNSSLRAPTMPTRRDGGQSHPMSFALPVSMPGEPALKGACLDLGTSWKLFNKSRRLEPHRFLGQSDESAMQCSSALASVCAVVLGEGTALSSTRWKAHGCTCSFFSTKFTRVGALGESYWSDGQINQSEPNGTMKVVNTG